jgi:hypothetical protein
MTSNDLADYIVVHLNLLVDPIIAFQATNPETIAEASKEVADFQVFVMPFEESEESIDRADTCREERVVSVVVNGPIGQVTKAIALQFAEELRYSLRETEFEGYRWQGNETVSVLDADALKTKGQFLHLFRATYYTFA